MHHKKELQELMRTYSSMKALQLLVALADCEGEISLAQLSAATGIPPSSTRFSRRCSTAGLSSRMR